MRYAFMDVLQLNSFVSILLSGGIFIFSTDLTRFVLGERWLPIIPALQILCFFGATRAIGASMGPILLALGKPKVQTMLSLLQLIMMALIIFPLGREWGLIGVAYAVLFPNIFALLSISFVTMKYLRVSYATLLKQVYFPVLITVSACLVVISLRTYLWNTDGLLGVSVFVALFLISYVFFFLLFNRLFDYRLEDTLLKRIVGAI